MASAAPLHEPHLTPGRLRPLLASAERLRIGVVGDFCLDVYWTLAAAPGAVSLESGKRARSVAEQRCAPGGAGATALCLRALGCHVEAFGFDGDDAWGRELRRRLEMGGVKTAGLLHAPDGWATPAYIKPYRGDEEQERYDIGTTENLPTIDTDELAEVLAGRLGELDVVVVSEQLDAVVVTPHLVDAINKMIQKHPKKLFIVDSRNRAGDFRGAILRVTAGEAAAAIGEAESCAAAVSREKAERAARELASRNGRPAIVSRGERGAIVAAGGDLVHVPAVQVLGKVDPAGAGDAMTAAVAAALGCGEGPLEAAALGCLAASVVCAKRRQTGTASAAEILAAADDVDLIYWPDLAEDSRAAHFAAGTEIEQVSGGEPPRKITHAIFDHDGTISTLRQGWEAIMEPMMVRAILGPRFSDIDSATYQRIVGHSKEFIDKTTGIQTLIQMQGLGVIVGDYGFVPKDEILDEHGYKKIYNDALIGMVHERVARLKKGELTPNDYAMKGSIELLHAMKKAGIVLYLASGTDEPDVKAEAAAMGYADLFAGHIYGSTGDVTKDAKKMVLDRILAEIGGEAMAGVVTIGDGPVELRETRKRGGFTIGVASDEVRRHGWNLSKRPRLVRAGCDWLIPDFAQLPQLLRMLHVTE